MKILLTGISGFLGSHVAALLNHQGHEIFALIRKTSKLDHLSFPFHRIEVFVGLVCNGRAFFGLPSYIFLGQQRRRRPIAPFQLSSWDFWRRLTKLTS